jgi:hypothetical protein
VPRLAVGGEHQDGQAASASIGTTAMRASCQAESAEFGYGLTERSRYEYTWAS